MLSNLALAGSALVIQSERQDVTADNLANVSTAGYKRYRLSVRSVAPAEAQFQSVLNDAMGEPAGSLATSASRDTSAGQLVPSGNPTDLALLSPGYFSVQDGGRTAYTRNGAFQLDPNSTLVDSEGRAVLGDNGSPIRITGESWAVETDGTVTVDGVFAGRLGIVEFSQPQLAERLGNSLFTAPRVTVRPAPAPQVKQGYTESSNVNAIQEMVQMVTDLRAFEASQKLLVTQDQLLDKTVSDVGRV